MLAPFIKSVTALVFQISSPVAAFRQTNCPSVLAPTNLSICLPKRVEVGFRSDVDGVTIDGWCNESRFAEIVPAGQFKPISGLRYRHDAFV